MPTVDTTAIRRGASHAADEREAVAELAGVLAQPETSLVLFYCSPKYDLDVIADGLGKRFSGIEVLGCTSMGEIGPSGYLDGSISGVSVTADVMRVASRRIDDLQSFELSRGAEVVESLRQELAKRGSTPTGQNTFGFLLIDGLSLKEELVVSSLYRGMGDLQLFGGSAADQLEFRQAHIYHDGAFHRDSAVFTMMQTDRPFEIFKTQHFVESDQKMVVTGADAPSRTVFSINGESAAEEYARIMGITTDKLTPIVFAAHPVMVRLGGDNYIRSIMRVNEDGSIQFACAIDEGIVLTVAERGDLVENLRGHFAGIRERIGEPALVLGCDCAFRTIEIDQAGVRGQVGEILKENNVVGFSSFGEQLNAMHVNQTFTGVAIGPKDD